MRRLARPLLASIFITGGIDALRNPGPRVELVRNAGLSSPEQLVRANAAAGVVAGLMLATNRLPRLSSLVLAGSLAPTTYVGHPFWSEKDKAVRKQQQVHFFKNLGLLGGLILSAADTGGRESLPHATARVSRSAGKKLAAAQKSAAASAHSVAATAHSVAASAQSVAESVVESVADAAKAIPHAA